MHDPQNACFKNQKHGIAAHANEVIKDTITSVLQVEDNGKCQVHYA